MTRTATYRCDRCKTLFDDVTRFTVHGGNRPRECGGHDTEHCMDCRAATDTEEPGT